VVEANKTAVGQAGCGVTPNPIAEGQSVVTSKQPFSLPLVYSKEVLKPCPLRWLDQNERDCSVLHYPEHTSLSRTHFILERMRGFKSF
jgi:hypothetical protein